jgi:hypothetical protein
VGAVDLEAGDAAGLRWGGGADGPRGWVEMEKKLGLKGGKKEWIEPRRRMWAG